MPDLITADLVVLDEDLGPTKQDVSARLAALVTASGRASDTDGLLADVAAREAQAPTGLPGGIGIPHCRSEYVNEPTLAFARLAPPVDFGAPDGPADIVFLIAAPAGGEGDHLTLLTALARALVRPEFTSALRSAGSAQVVVGLVADAVSPPASATSAAPAAAAASTAAVTASAGATGDGATSNGATGDGAPSPRASAPTTLAPAATAGTVLVAITACPTGIAHTFMAAESLEAAAARAGVTLHVEPQGSTGAPPLSSEIVSSATAVIFATDVGVRNRERFAGKPVIASGVKRAINEPDKMIAEAIAASTNPNAASVQGDATAGAAQSSGGSGDVSFGVKLRQWLLTGVSYMIPFVAAGGLLIALGFLFAGYEIALAGDEGFGNRGQQIVAQNSFTNLPAGGFTEYVGAALFVLGVLAFGFLVPALAGYIAFAMADRPGIAPGFTVGVLATTIGAGFLGGIVGGLLAGGVALWISRWKVPTFARGLMPVVVIPLLATLISGGLMLFVLGRPIAAVTDGLESWLNGLAGGSAIVLGIILGLMMAFDMGGPVNKAAYAFAVAGLAAASAGTNDSSLSIMATVMAAGMAPPLALALATVIRPKSFSAAERENGKAAWLLGASFITEGAIPFAAADPLRVIPPIMLGSATTGALIMAADVTLRAPHGGIFVLFAIGNIAMFVVAILAGTVIGAVAVVLAKRIGRTETVGAETVPAT